MERRCRRVIGGFSRTAWDIRSDTGGTLRPLPAVDPSGSHPCSRPVLVPTGRLHCLLSDRSPGTPEVDYPAETTRVVAGPPRSSPHRVSLEAL